MSQQTVYENEVIKEAVAIANDALRADAKSWFAINNRNINFVEGVEADVIKALQQIGNDPKAAQNGRYKLPFVCVPLVTSTGANVGGLRQASFPSLILAALSDDKRLPEAKRETNFKPILMPMYDMIIKCLLRHPAVLGLTVNDIQHTRLDYPAGATDKANTYYNEIVDLVVLEGLKFTIRRQVCAC